MGITEIVASEWFYGLSLLVIGLSLSFWPVIMIAFPPSSKMGMVGMVLVLIGYVMILKAEGELGLVSSDKFQVDELGSSASRLLFLARLCLSVSFAIGAFVHLRYKDRYGHDNHLDLSTNTINKQETK